MALWTKFVVCADYHGDQHEPEADRAFRKFVAAWRPQIRVFAGDLWDFRSIRKNASPEERRDSLLMDFRTGVDFLEWYRPQHFLRGNHDERLWDLVNHKGVEGDFAVKGIEDIEKLCKKLRCQMLPYHKREGVLRLGHLKVIHGFFSGLSAARQTALAYGACLFGHSHTIEEHAIAGLERRVARCIGSLCRRDMDYNRAHVNTLRHANGWAYGVVNEATGVYQVWQAENLNGSFLTVGNFQVFDGDK